MQGWIQCIQWDEHKWQQGQQGSPLMMLLVYVLAEVLLVQHRVRVIENEFLHE